MNLTLNSDIKFFLAITLCTLVYVRHAPSKRINVSSDQPASSLSIETAICLKKNASLPRRTS